MSRSCAVFYSPGAEKGAQLSLLKKAFENNKLWAEFYSIRDCEKQAPKLSASIFVAAGGDGTVNTVASQAYKLKKTLGVIPLGTLNHFAKDSGIPLVMAQAVELIAKAKTKRIDIATANGQLFLNNSSIGIYPTVVRAREKLEKRLGKWPAAAIAILFTARRRLKLYSLDIALDGKPLNRNSSLLFVGNNAYRLKGVGLPERSTLWQGKLHIYVLKTKRIDRLIKTAAYGFWGKQLPEEYIERFDGTKLVVDIHSRKQLWLAYDGEIKQTLLPLTYKLHAKALAVIVK